MNEDKIIQKLIELDEKIDGLATQDSLNEFRNDVTDTLDRHTHMLERLDHERLFMIERVKRVEDGVQELKAQPKLT